MAYYNVCPKCGSNLDPGEKCDCEKEVVKRQDFFNSHLKIEPKSRQLAFAFDGKEAKRESKIIC
ncbi:MAG: hypothetical protein LUH14_01220 [Clostridiaceae bacterium]|nr:hypothetical protein [Clostridiaceae bacterium]